MVFQKSGQNKTYMVFVLNKVGRKKDVVEINEHKPVYEIMEDIVYQPLEDSGGVG